MKRLYFATAIVLAVTPFVGGTAQAQSYPDRPVKLIAPASAGGATDLVARIAADYLSKKMGQRFYVENRTGAGGNIGTAEVAKASPDGYTLGIVASGNVVINPYLYKNMSFDAKTDLVPVAPIVEAPQVIAISAKVPAKTLKQFIALAKAKPNTINYATAGVGSTMHLAGVEFSQLAGVKLIHVPYRGAAPAVKDIVAGVDQMIPVSATAIMSFVQAGKIRVLATATKHRLKWFPNVPTAAEAGLPGYEMTTWFAIVAPRGTPDAIVQKLNVMVRNMLKDPTSLKRLEASYLVPMPMTQKKFTAFVASEFPKWKKVVAESGLKPH